MKQRFTALLKERAPEKIFLLIAVPFCLFFLVAIPALQGWDEATHFLRAYQVSEHDMFAEKTGPRSWGGNLPVNVLQMNDAFLSDLIQSAQSGLKRSVHTRAYLTYATVTKPDKVTATRNFESSAVYSPVAYLPPAIGIAFARLVHLPLIFYIYVGRLATLIVWLVLMYYAIKRIPVGKWVLVALALLPTSATQAVSLGPDAFLIGSVTLLVAIFLDHTLAPRVFTRKELLLSLSLMLVLGLVKGTYIPLIAIFLLLPLRNFGNWKRYTLINGGLILITLIVSCAWLLSVSDIAQNIHIAQRPGVNVNPQQQISYIEHHPLSYSAIVANRVIDNNSNPMYSMMVGVITWKGIMLPQWANLLSYLMLIAGFLAIRFELVKLKNLQFNYERLYRPGIVVLLVVTVVAIYTSLYLSFSVVKSTNIEGMHGRYFLPLIPLLVPLFLKPGKHPLIALKIERLPRVITALSVTVLTVASAVLIAANFVPDLF